MNLKISSRQSALAQLQALQVGEALERQFSCQIEFLFRESLGDRNLTDPLWKMPEKGVFTEDFYQDLLAGKTDLVVHSWKDLPTEKKAATTIGATLPRADQRDLLLFKKSSLQKRELRLFSSSPRRAFNLGALLPSILPWKTQQIEYLSVRGNIQTRLRKLLEAPEVDGLVLAKAAMDRLLAQTHFPEISEFLRQVLAQCQWMALPLSENPNAAAQGALALEFLTSNQALHQKLQEVNCVSSFHSAGREREILQEFGGGCHLALGMAVLERDYGRIEMVRGLTPQGETIHSKKFFPNKKRTFAQPPARLNFRAERRVLNEKKWASVQSDGVFVSRVEAWVANSAPVVWAAGLQTWKKLAALGVWVQGCAEGLGEAEDPRIEVLFGRPLTWTRLTHQEAEANGSSQSTYHLQLQLLSTELPPAPALLWHSGGEFKLALQKFPEIKSRLHCCGPGRTYQQIKEILGNEDNLYVELKDGFVTAI